MPVGDGVPQRCVDVDLIADGCSSRRFRNIPHGGHIADMLRAPCGGDTKVTGVKGLFAQPADHVFDCCWLRIWLRIPCGIHDAGRHSEENSVDFSERLVVIEEG